MKVDAFFILYIMIYKFICNEDKDTAIEFKKSGEYVSIFATDFEPDMRNQSANNVCIKLNKDDLFELIGNLLRIQSQFKKEV